MKILLYIGAAYFLIEAIVLILSERKRRKYIKYCREMEEQRQLDIEEKKEAEIYYKASTHLQD